IAARIIYNPASNYAKNVVSLAANSLSINPILRGLAIMFIIMSITILSLGFGLARSFYPCGKLIRDAN
ncbi:hypothetical protein JMJ77_0008689, partial [Colletotrichum scovillei]